jgi:hypothetical protein
MRWITTHTVGSILSPLAYDVGKTIQDGATFIAADL